ncbi:hypothetical protein ACFO6R_08365 [Eubacterium multiforme]|uniref:General stress protein 26 n=1 Tax=Eubacterium multiforme TaxID=83339 RepID=A0ABT9UUM5_9FIRM|nr:hypothetical protein [Eubacterium multiforme]MDQ0150016.1 general stress protein 26 [Eubacterium multiforme]
MTKDILYENAIRLLNKSNTLSLSVVDENGYPIIYAMEKVLQINLEKVIFITKKVSKKVSLLNINNKCCVEVHTEDDMVCLKGYIEIKNSEKDKKEILPKNYIQRLKNSGSDKYCLLIFHTLNAHLYIDGILKTIPIQ